jgi:hypothetical protein
MRVEDLVYQRVRDVRRRRRRLVSADLSHAVCLQHWGRSDDPRPGTVL